MPPVRADPVGILKLHDIFQGIIGADQTVEVDHPALLVPVKGQILTRRIAAVADDLVRAADPLPVAIAAAERSNIDHRIAVIEKGMNVAALRQAVAGDPALVIDLS